MIVIDDIEEVIIEVTHTSHNNEEVKHKKQLTVISYIPAEAQI